MTNEEIAIKLTEHQEEIGSLKHRMKASEEKSKQLLNITTSIQKMTTTMEYMAKEQKRQADEQTKTCERLEKLEREPSETFKAYKKTIISSLITGALGTIVGALLMLILK